MEFDIKSTFDTSIKYDSEEKIFLERIRQIILVNLAKNISFRMGNKIQRKAIENIYDILQKTRISATKDEMAQLISLLAFSKLDLKPAKFSAIFSLFKFIEILEVDEEFEIRDELSKFHQAFVNFSTIQDIIINTCDEIFEMKISDIQLKEIKIVYFYSTIEGLHGFSGRDEIYVSISEINSLIESMDSMKISKADQLHIIKLNFFRVFIHEAAHLVLRKSCNDFNCFTPNILTPSQKKKFSKSEAGLIMENKLFKSYIDWNESVKQNTFNLDYCKMFLSNLIANNILDFDPELARTVERENYVMGLDLSFKKTLSIC
ncbi:unnamed protein product [Brachionus calyciflorus]|uniref:Uncharacterized protein n=1 Tax=Brachionus calyciflorus TaxID=104777 RepID=A0A814IQK9_9BILA|nr:unnamed protein product [Brachionus calyciflorus]